MSEYIEREAAKEAVQNALAFHSYAGGTAASALDKIHTADVRPVVLCRDCKNNYNTCLNHGINQPMCDFTDRKLREDDFCSRGEKREES